MLPSFAISSETKSGVVGGGATFVAVVVGAETGRGMDSAHPSGASTHAVASEKRRRRGIAAARSKFGAGSRMQKAATKWARP
jgi:hypothetical protein